MRSDRTNRSLHVPMRGAFSQLRAIRAVLVVMSMLLLALPASAQTLAVVDFNVAAERTVEGKKATDKFEALYTSRQTELQKLQQEFEKGVQEYQNSQMIMSPEARAQREQELGMQQAQLQQSAMEAEQELSQLQMQMTTQLSEKMRAVVVTIAKERGIDLVFDVAVAPYVGPKIVDLTDALISAYDAAHK